jgi:hypothetical protein
MEKQTPKRAEDDYGCHMQSPTGERIGSHLCLAHSLEEELHVPSEASESAKKIVSQQRGTSDMTPPKLSTIQPEHRHRWIVHLRPPGIRSIRRLENPFRAKTCKILIS